MDLLIMVLEISAALLLIVGLTKQPELVAFENRLLEKVKRKFSHNAK